jgi:PucR family transcriptional regulator, purine catabolism regulatory protein
MDRLTPLTVAEALRDTALSAAQLVAGEAGLEREIESVAVLDVADVDAVLPQQLVLVTAYALQGSDLRELVRQLDARGASGLGVNLGASWSSMPEPLMAAATAAELPLLVLPRGRFDDLTNPLLSAIVERQAAVLQSIADFHRNLTEAALHDEAWEATATCLADALGAEVATFDEDGELLAATARTREWPDRLAVAAISAADGGPIEMDGETFLVSPISAKGRRYGAVCVGGVDPADTVARAAIAEAAVVTGMQILARRHVDEVHRRFERALLDDLVSGRLSEREARERAERVGWPIRRPYLAIYAAPQQPTAASAPLLGDEHVPAVDRSLRGGHFARSFPYRGGLAVIVHFARTEDPRAVAADTAARLARMRRVPWAGSPLRVGASRLARDIARLRDAAREARLACELRAAAPGGDGVVHFDQLGAGRLLAKVPDPGRLAAAAVAELAADGDPDGPLTPDLIDTLTTLIGSNMRIGRSADELYFHYNTVRHRLARLRDHFGPRLDSEDGRTTLWLAVMALQIAELDGVPDRLAPAPAD